jgi:hypothetical protein
MLSIFHEYNENSCKILVGNHLQNYDLEDPEGDGRITLSWILGKEVVRIGVRWNRLTIISNGSGF